MTPDWSRKFDEPIIVPPKGKRGRARTLITLKDAGEYITKLPKAEHTASEWQGAMSALMLAARGGPVMLARTRGISQSHATPHADLLHVPSGRDVLLPKPVGALGISAEVGRPTALPVVISDNAPSRN
jgi:hypothetical protein